MTFTPELTELEELRAEVQAHRDGLGHLAEDPPAPGREILVGRSYDDEATFHQQVTHNGQPVWICADCVRLTVGDRSRCAGCGLPGQDANGDDNLSAVWSKPLTCRSWDPANAYDGPCLIAGSDGCECEEASR